MVFALLKSTHIYQITKTPFFLPKVTGSCLAGFVDTFVTLGRSFVKFEKISNFNVTLIDSLGFVVHQDKSRFV